MNAYNIDEYFNGISTVSRHFLQSPPFRPHLPALFPAIYNAEHRLPLKFRSCMHKNVIPIRTCVRRVAKRCTQISYISFPAFKLSTNIWFLSVFLSFE